VGQVVRISVFRLLRRRLPWPEPWQGLDNCQTKEAANEHVEVKVGSRSVIVEQCELNNLIEAVSEMKNLAASSRALMNTGSS
jgi:hypothetical protein